MTLLSRQPHPLPSPSTTIFPGASEACTGADDDCDEEIDEGVTSTFCADADQDTYGTTLVTTESCDSQPPGGHVVASTGCDDEVPDVNPGGKRRNNFCGRRNVFGQYVFEARTSQRFGPGIEKQLWGRDIGANLDPGSQCCLAIAWRKCSDSLR